MSAGRSVAAATFSPGLDGTPSVSGTTLVYSQQSHEEVGAYTSVFGRITWADTNRLLFLASRLRIIKELLHLDAVSGAGLLHHVVAAGGKRFVVEVGRRPRPLRIAPRPLAVHASLILSSLPAFVSLVLKHGLGQDKS